jgi:HSP20 family protein
MIIRRYFDRPAYELKSPFEELERMKTGLDKLLEKSLSSWPGGISTGVFPLTNITEDKEALYLRAELPGMKANDLDISITGNSISISGKREIPAEEENAKYHRREREAGSFRRMIKLPVQIDTKQVKAKSVNGVLTIVMPKAENAKPKRIEVKAS